MVSSVFVLPGVFVTGRLTKEMRHEPPEQPGADRSNAKPTVALELASRVRQE